MSGSGHPFPKWTPPEIISAYSEKNINNLFDWQADVLTWSEVNDDNIVYTAPTSAGKSVVAELIALRVALSGKRVLFLLPYISVAKEKLRFLQRAWRRVDIQMAAFVGAQSAPSREWTAAVCTTEKANSLLNHAILDGIMNEIGLIVIDELHMVFDSSRGVVLESLCAKINLWNSRNSTERIRVIGMSATLENLEQVGDWLSAKVFETHFRPVQLHERICCDGHISELGSGNIIRDVPKRFRVPEDPECVLGLAAEGIFLKKLVLVFSSSKADVEKIALDLAKILDGIYRSNHVIAARVNRSALHAVQANIQRTAGTMDAVLSLTSEERECIEQGFRDGIIMVLVATSTLSSGVNLPAGRVVIKAQIRGPAAINATTYRQMSGRAGRLGQLRVARQDERSVAVHVVVHQRSLVVELADELEWC
ncbi:helicase protein [Ancylostoma ceylanicum]|uniref:Helicase protein n=1 Tax=Ancylostoma ceylanicum TaxID=53326 RepID=A0A0D6LUS1_9BILA|nr:helicase protein [Ancylostoma ceylanicum]